MGKGFEKYVVVEEVMELVKGVLTIAGVGLLCLIVVLWFLKEFIMGWVFVLRLFGIM